MKIFVIVDESSGEKFIERSVASAKIKPLLSFFHTR